tara:strand:- start:38 stop:844 length:807 start_codon:yes stop_codon:yes gene_type:complete
MAADACWIDFGCASELEASQRSLDLSEQEITLNGSVEKRSVADAAQNQISTTTAATSPISKTVEVEDSAEAVEVSPPSAEDYSCPICLELLLRPITLSCGHRLCRGCWACVLQRRTVLFASNATCPLGRCSVGPTVPTIDLVHMRELEFWFGPQLLARAAEHALADEERTVSVVNARTAADYKPDTYEVTMAPVESMREERGSDADGWVARALTRHGLRGMVARAQLWIARLHGCEDSWIPCITVLGVLSFILLLSGFGCLIASHAGR